MNKIRHGQLIESLPETIVSLPPIESMMCPPSGREYDSDSDLEEDEDEQSEQSRPHDSGGSGRV